MVFVDNVVHNLTMDTTNDDNDDMIEAFHVCPQPMHPPLSQPRKGTTAIMKVSPIISHAPSPKSHASFARFAVVPTSSVCHGTLAILPFLWYPFHGLHF